MTEHLFISFNLYFITVETKWSTDVSAVNGSTHSVSWLFVTSYIPNKQSPLFCWLIFRRNFERGSVLDDLANYPLRPLSVYQQKIKIEIFNLTIFFLFSTGFFDCLTKLCHVNIRHLRAFLWYQDLTHRRFFSRISYLFPN